MMLQAPAPVTELVGVARGLGVFVLWAVAVYVPARFLVLPAVRWLLEYVGVSPTWELPVLKVLNLVFGGYALFVAASASGFSSFLRATQVVVAAATIALGLAAQDVLGNFVSGAIIVIDPQYNIGDWIQWKDREGVIEDISFRVTRIHTFDNELIAVPNSELTTTAVTNPVAKDRLRITYEFGVGYDEDLDRVRGLIVAAADDHPEILERPAPTVHLRDLDESWVTMWARFWIADPKRTDFVRIRSEFVQAVKERFEDDDVELPYPMRQLTGSVETRPSGRTD